MSVKISRLVIAGLSGDSGKTVVSLAMLAALKRRGMKIIPFKKGPDYIDAAWLGSVSGHNCRNLDTWLVDRDGVLDIFTGASAGADLALVEGNRGLFDGKDVEGTHSTAGLAELLQAPLILVIDATKATRTLAALVKGCQSFAPDLNIAGVILNKVAGPRHRRIITESIEKYCDLPVAGSLPKLGEDAQVIPGRHLGLIPPAEYAGEHDFIQKLISIAENNIDLDKLIDIASAAPELEKKADYHHVKFEKPVKIGYFRDSIFTFYYPENLEALERLGAVLVPVNSMTEEKLPEVDALYIGGGFPETQADRLTMNRSLMDSVKQAAERNMPIYAECGGLIYLCRSLDWQGKNFRMADIFPVDLAIRHKPAGHGYTLLRVDRKNHFFKEGAVIKGHEFHYSAPVSDFIPDSCFHVETGVGFGNNRDGLIYKKVLAVYTHIHAAGEKDWARAMLTLAAEYAENRASDADCANDPSGACTGTVTV